MLSLTPNRKKIKCQYNFSLWGKHWIKESFILYIEDRLCQFYVHTYLNPQIGPCTDRHLSLFVCVCAQESERRDAQKTHKGDRECVSKREKETDGDRRSWPFNISLRLPSHMKWVCSCVCVVGCQVCLNHRSRAV